MPGSGPSCIIFYYVILSAEGTFSFFILEMESNSCSAYMQDACKYDVFIYMY